MASVQGKNLKPRLTQNFVFTDHNGRKVDKQTLTGHILLVYFGFTHCRVVCPRALNKLTTVLELLDKQDISVLPLYVSVDPARDTPKRMKSYLESQFPRFIGLSGSESVLSTVKDEFKVFAGYRADPDDPDGYSVPHSAFAYLIGPAGEYLEHYGDNYSGERIAESIVSAYETLNRDLR